MVVDLGSRHCNGVNVQARGIVGITKVVRKDNNVPLIQDNDFNFVVLTMFDVHIDCYIRRFNDLGNIKREEY